MSSILYIRENEAQILSQYLIGERCSDDTVHHYAEAVGKLNASLTETEQSTWNKMVGFSFYLKLVDSGLAVTSPQSALRKRIFIMLALLEASPDHVKFFLPQERSIWYLIPLGLRAAISAVYMIIGAVTVKMLGIT